MCFLGRIGLLFISCVTPRPAPSSLPGSSPIRAHETTRSRSRQGSAFALTRVEPRDYRLSMLPAPRGCERALYLAGRALIVAFSCFGCTRGDATTMAESRPAGSASTTPAATNSAQLARVEVPVEVERLCRAMCDRSRLLNCESTAKCMPNCLAMGSITPCTTEILGMFSCMTGEPEQNWQCGADGVAAIRSGFCDKEQGIVVACMEARMR
jgi:hypothetical protein